MLRLCVYTTLFLSLFISGIGLQEQKDAQLRQVTLEHQHRLKQVAPRSKLHFSTFAYANPLPASQQAQGVAAIFEDKTERMLSIYLSKSQEPYAFMKEEAISATIMLQQVNFEGLLQKPLDEAISLTDLPTHWLLPHLESKEYGVMPSSFEPLFGYKRSMLYLSQEEDMPTHAGLMTFGASIFAKAQGGFGISGLPDETAVAGKPQTFDAKEQVALKSEVVTRTPPKPLHGSSPALGLGLTQSNYQRSEKCLSDAVYYEARSEPEKGQVAVAQVVVNRALSGYYPDDVCKVVYQNAHRHLACQFTFACEGKKLIITDKPSWERAKRIARDMLAGKIWLSDVSNSTHYHASYVSPYWAKSMHKRQKIGLHSFYRPREWN